MDPRYEYQQNSAPDYHQQQPQQNQQPDEQQNQQQNQQPHYLPQQQQQQPDRYSTPHYMPQRSSSVYNPSYHKSRFGFWYWFRWLFALIPLGIGAVVLFKPQVFENLINDISNKVGAPGAASTYTPTMPTIPTTPTSTKALQQAMLTYGPGGDIPLGAKEHFFAPTCTNWTPKKGQPFPKSGGSIGCYAPHAAEFFEDSWPKNGTDKDAAYPTPEQWLADAGSVCSKAFMGTDVAVPNKEDALKLWILIPSAENFKSKIENGYVRNERRYYCYATKADGSPLTAPLNGK